MNLTDILKLSKPGYDDPIDIEVLNKNMDLLEKGYITLDEAIKNVVGKPYHVGYEPPADDNMFWIDLNELDEENSDSIISLINQKADKKDMGELSDLQTENKDNLVNAINDIVFNMRDVVKDLIDEIPEVFHDVEQNKVKESMNPSDFEYGVTLCSHSVVGDFPTINEYGVSYTLIGRHSNYAQIFITRFGDIWARRSTERTTWNGEWYNAKKEIESLELELEELKATGGSQEDINKLEESIKELESKMPETLDDLYVSDDFPTPADEVVKSLVINKANQSEVDGLQEYLNAIGDTVYSVESTADATKQDVGELSDLQTENKDNLVSAINEIDESKLNKDGDTATGIIKAHSNTNYGVGQIRNITISTAKPNVSDMNNGDIWLQYDE